jgi:hypothetical protein
MDAATAHHQPSPQSKVVLVTKFVHACGEVLIGPVALALAPAFVCRRR